jgi:hypothetical protein
MTQDLDQPPPVELAGTEAEALIALLRDITAQLEDARRDKLADTVSRITAILRVRQWTDGYRKMTGGPR